MANAETAQDNGSHEVAYLDKRYTINFASPIQHFSTEFATAYPASIASAKGKVYILIFNRHFALRAKAMRVLATHNSANLSSIVEQGKVILPDGNESLGAVIAEPEGMNLIDYMKENGRFSEKEVVRNYLDQLLEGLEPLTRQGVAHGSLNPYNIFINPKNKRLVIRECVSSFCGYIQRPAYEDINDLLCNPISKGSTNIPSDYYALGIILLSMITGADPFMRTSRDRIRDWRLLHGSCDAVIKQIMQPLDLSLNRRTDLLLKGLLTDDDINRWGLEEVQMWRSSQEVTAPASKIHKETSNSFIFNGIEFNSTKWLASYFYNNWALAKRSIRILELKRWISLGLKDQVLAERLESLIPDPKFETILSDNKLTRLIMILDPTGPIRYHSISSTVSGLATTLEYIYTNEKRDMLQHLAYIITDGMLRFWISLQHNADDYSQHLLGWHPYRVSLIIRKHGLGFGMERLLYEMNTLFPCQSNMLKKYYVSSVSDLLKALDTLSFDPEKNDNDPIDRHIAAFVGSRLGLKEEMVVRNLKGYPIVARNPQVLHLGLLSIAQKSSGIRELKNLSNWFFHRLSSLYDNLNSLHLRKEVKQKLEEKSKTGRLDQMFLTVTNPLFVKKDVHGFYRAKKKYLQIERTIRTLKHHSTLQKVAYNLGLRSSVNIAYIVLVCTIFYTILSV